MNELCICEERGQWINSTFPGGASIAFQCPRHGPVKIDFRSLVRPDVAVGPLGPLPGAARGLTPRQVQVCVLVTRGMDISRIADEMQIGHQVVKNYLHKIYRKVGVESKLELALWCVQHKVGAESSPSTLSLVKD